MNNNIDISPAISPGTTIKPRFLDQFAKKVLLSKLALLEHGQIILVDDESQYQFGNINDNCLKSNITVNHSSFYSDIVFGGSIGAGEAYMMGSWNTDNLTALIQIFARNQSVMDNMENGMASLLKPLQKSLHWLNRNTYSGSQKNISAHYDIGNDFFGLMLDKTMMYSSAIFENKDSTLYEAQVYRLDTICKKLDLKPSDQLLEIGTGWGSLAIHAAKHYGCKVTTTTISKEQFNLARKRVKEENLESRVIVLLEDYRNLVGEYDKLVSIEMIEAVGHQFYDTYFAKCSSLIKPEGRMLLQAITIADQRYESAKKSVDFIQRYIFPGSCIPSITAMLHSITKSSDMCLFDLEDIGVHYATTLRKWRENVDKNEKAIKKMGYSEEFLRMWKFYLCYCEGGFLERAISDVHMVLAKPTAKMSA